MSVYVICVEDDLRDDAELYANATGANYVGSLEDVGDDDTVVLYTHGVYGTGTGVAQATNEIVWDGDHIDATECYRRLAGVADLNRVQRLTLIVHACFSAGTIEAPPRAARRVDTFAGQLCSAMRAHFPNLRVIGFQGASKVGKAGFAAVNPVSNNRRVLRGQVDPNDASLWQVVYAWDGARVAVNAEGASVTWS